jgi:lipopolysaccharide biosynthesis regulator YciM
LDFDLQWLLLALPVAFFLGWLASRLDVRQMKREEQPSPRAYFKGLNLLLNEQQDKAIDAFIEAVQHDPDTSDLHFALGNLFRRRGEYERAVRVHQHLLGRGDLPRAERERAQHALAQDFLKAGLFDRAEEAFRALEGTAFATDARLALLTLHERARDWHKAIEIARRIEAAGAGSFSTRISHHWCEITQEADAKGRTEEADDALAKAREAAPTAARPQVLAGQRLARAGRHAEALAAWGELLASQPGSFSLVARDYAASAAASGAQAQAATALRELYARAPSTDLLLALVRLEADVQQREQALLAHVREHRSLTAALNLMQQRSGRGEALAATAAEPIERAIAEAARPLQRFRCAACGFESQAYFWQCPGCQSWDSYPPRRLEDL